MVDRGELNAVTEKLDGVGPVPDGESNEPTEALIPPENIEGDDDEMIFDSVTDRSSTSEGRSVEGSNFVGLKKQQIYEPVDIDEAWQVTGKAPITLKWVDRNKGDWQHPNFRSRLVVREVKKKGQMLDDAELFSAMPPLEALKVLCSLMVSMKASKHGGALKLRILDISRAHFYGESRRPVYANLPPGREQEGKCARLRKSTYGTQDASSIWQETYSKLLREHNMVQGVAWPAIFYHEATDSRFLCHSDDFVVLADSKGQQIVEEVLRKKFELRVHGSIGPEAGDGKAMTVLNRILEFDNTTGPIRYEADPRHAETVIRQLGLDEAKPVVTPAEKVSSQEALAASWLPALPSDRSSLYRLVVMRCAYLSQDRVDICESVETLARFMASPTEHSWGKLKRLGRYLKGCPRVVQEFKAQEA